MKIYDYRIVSRQVADIPETKGDSAQAAADYITKHCFKEEDNWREACYALFLDRKCHIRGHMNVSLGSTKETIIDSMMVTKCAIDVLADAVILTHNHPSNDPTPSKNNIEATKRIKLALRLFDIKLLDHIIISEDKAYSFSEERTFRTT